MLTLTSSVEIWAHRVPAGAKLLALAGATVGLFQLSTPLALGGAALAVVVLVASGGRVFLHESMTMLRPLWPFVLIVGLWHLITGDISGGAVVILRMGAAVAAANFVTMTTRLSDMLGVIERLLSPLRYLGLRTRPLALALALVIRFVPVMLTRIEAISVACRARSRGGAGWRILMPATLAALDDAERVADALRARGGAG
ncbi:MAG: CbiQ family ECF transporter T component [Paracoccaceae bacterium]